MAFTTPVDAEGLYVMSERLDKDRRRKAEDGGSSTDAADAAVKAQRRLKRVYREATSALLNVEDLRVVAGKRELYQRFSRISETLIEAADRICYATVKER